MIQFQYLILVSAFSHCSWYQLSHVGFPGKPTLRILLCKIFIRESSEELHTGKGKEKSGTGQRKTLSCDIAPPRELKWPCRVVSTGLFCNFPSLSVNHPQKSVWPWARCFRHLEGSLVVALPAAWGVSCSWRDLGNTSLCPLHASQITQLLVPTCLLTTVAWDRSLNLSDCQVFLS